MVRKILQALQERVDYANRRMVEECCSGEDDAARYWVLYKDGVNAAIRDVEAVAAEAANG